MSHQNCPPRHPPPHTTTDYAIYKDVLPSVRTLQDYKEIQSSEQQTQAVLYLMSKSTDNRAILHYDTTSRATRAAIDGEWASLILNFQGEKDLD